MENKTFHITGVLSHAACTRHNYRFFNLFTISKRPFSKRIDKSPPKRWLFAPYVESKIQFYLDYKLLSFGYVKSFSIRVGQKPNIKINDIPFLKLLVGKKLKMKAYKVDGQVPQLSESEYYPIMGSIEVIE